MRTIVVLVLFAFARPAFADDFDRWAVPDPKPPFASCDGDAVACVHLAWTLEAGIPIDGASGTDRLEAALRDHRKACDLAHRKSCANADRVQAKLDAFRALKTDDERASFWCEDALDGAKLFAAGSAAAPRVAQQGCAPEFPIRFRKMVAWAEMAKVDKKPRQVLDVALRYLCRDLKEQPAACSNQDVDRVPPAKRRAVLAEILGAAMAGDLAARAGELAGWMIK